MSLRAKLKLFSRLFWAGFFLCSVVVTLISPIYVVALKYHSLQYLSPKRKKKESMIKKVTNLLKALEFTSDRRQESCNYGRDVRTIAFTSLSSHLWFEAAIKAQISNIWRTGPFLPTVAPTKHVQVVPGTHMQLPVLELRGGGWVATTVLRAKIDQI